MKIYTYNEYRSEFPESSPEPTLLSDGSLWDAVAKHADHDRKRLELKRSLGICKVASLMGMEACELPTT